MCFVAGFLAPLSKSPIKEKREKYYELYGVAMPFDLDEGYGTIEEYEEELDRRIAEVIADPSIRDKYK